MQFNIVIPNYTRALLHCSWILGLWLPVAYALPETFDLSASPLYLYTVSLTEILLLRLLIPGRFFFIFTWPILLFGFARATASFLRGVNLIELSAQIPIYSRLEILDALRPYVVISIIGIFITGLWSFACYSLVQHNKLSRVNFLIAILGLLIIVKTTPETIISRAWPSDLAIISTSMVLGKSLTKDGEISNYLASNSPRNHKTIWKVVNKPEYLGNQQTLIFIIGESIRSDFLKECNGPEKVRAVSDGALVACDVTAGSDSTYYSVPLLVSRELPGHVQRVSTDSTFAAALTEVGFDSYWISGQFPGIAWPDTNHLFFEWSNVDKNLLPQVSRSIGGKRLRKVIVLHANNAHSPYCSRYDQLHAPYPISCKNLNGVPDQESLSLYKQSYANAVDASIGFVNQVIDLSRSAQGEVFVLFTPDHGEGFLDDSRQLYGHALTHPTRWDTHVPAIFWANDAWKQAHASKWLHLKSQIHAQLMHADMVPTFMAAAGVGYDDPRGSEVVNLLETPVPARRRVIQISPGVATDWQTLVNEANTNSL